MVQSSKSGASGVPYVPYFRTRTIRRNDDKGTIPHAFSYRGGLEKGIVNERTGTLHKQARNDVQTFGIVLPSRFKPNPRASAEARDKIIAKMAWARDPAKLANAMERSELRKSNKTRVGREYMAVLPKEFRHQKPLEHAQKEKVADSKRLKITREIAQKIADRQDTAVFYAIHLPKKGRAEHHHAHIVSATRGIGLNGFEERTKAEKQPRKETGRFRTEWTKLWKENGAEPVKTVRKRYRSNATGPGIAPIPYENYREFMRAQGFDVRAVEREFQRGAKLTPKEREAQKERKREIRERLEAELDRKRERKNRLARERRANERADLDPKIQKLRQRSQNRWEAGKRQQPAQRPEKSRTASRPQAISDDRGR